MQKVEHLPTLPARVDRPLLFLLRLEGVRRVLDRHAGHLDLVEVVGADTGVGQEFEVVVAGEGRLSGFGPRVESHQGGGDRVGADAVSPGQDDLRLDELDPEAATVVYCKAGSRSAPASQLLVENGFSEVYNMLGGYDAWVAAGYPTTTGEGGCFIATAAYGSAMEVHVGTLRDFRDVYLRTGPLGSGFVSLYYSASPPIAGLIDDHPTLKPLVRAGLLPAVAVSEMALSLNVAQKMALAGTAALLFAAIGLLLRRRLSLSANLRRSSGIPRIPMHRHSPDGNVRRPPCSPRKRIPWRRIGFPGGTFAPRPRSCGILHGSFQRHRLF